MVEYPVVLKDVGYWGLRVAGGGGMGEAAGHGRMHINLVWLTSTYEFKTALNIV